MKPTLFISDLHLGPQNPSRIDAFARWLQAQPGSCGALYILGDFFDAWIGDDDDSPLAQQVIEELNRFSSKTPTYFMRGNRDFLIGESFCQRAGLTLLEDPHTLELGGQRVLLMHGDTLCTADQEYQQFRAMVRSSAWQKQVLSLPLPQRRVMAADLRSKSQSMSAIKAEDIMDVTPSEVVKVMAQHQAQTLIHGHTHRPAIHDLTVNDKPAKRYVLGDWHETGWCIRADAEDMILEQFPLP